MASNAIGSSGVEIPVECDLASFRNDVEGTATGSPGMLDPSFLAHLDEMFDPVGVDGMRVRVNHLADSTGSVRVNGGDEVNA